MSRILDTLATKIEKAKKLIENFSVLRYVSLCDNSE